MGMTRADTIDSPVRLPGFMEVLTFGADVSMIGQFCVISKHNDNDEGFMEALSFGTEVSTIGQFGVDSYSTYLVTKRIHVVSKHDDDEQYIWESTGRGALTITHNAVNPPLGRGTELPQAGLIKESKTTKEALNKTNNDITPDEYAVFYQSLTNDREEHLTVKHFSVEGQLEFKASLLISKRNIKFHVRRVFIMDNCKDLIPKYLNFVKGIINSEDLPFIISCETLQMNKVLNVIRKNIAKKHIDLLIKIAEGMDNFAMFYEVFGKNLRLGIHEDAQNCFKLAELLYLHARDPEVDLLLTGKSLAATCDSSFLEMLKKKGFEVLPLVNPIVKHAITQLKEFEGKCGLPS
ncbi:hypothetical protein DXG01_005490 [Tephrocybe rancida]|nr:hypothetical protein DXG01_005490 [Tephrocybe rancida]